MMSYYYHYTSFQLDFTIISSIFLMLAITSLQIILPQRHDVVSSWSCSVSQSLESSVNY